MVVPPHADDLDDRPEITVETSPQVVHTVPEQTSSTPRTVIDLREHVDPLETDPQLAPFAVARRLDRPEDILAARRLHAQVFLKARYIGPEDIGEDGTVGTHVDPWPPHSTYFGVPADGRLSVTARQISPPAGLELPALKLPGIDGDALTRIHDLGPDGITEISALGRGRGAASTDVVAVYARMWRESQRQGHRAWLMAVDVRVFELLRALVCGDALVAIGPTQTYLGSPVVPAIIWFQEIAHEHFRMARNPRQSLHELLPVLFPAAPQDLP